MKWVLIIQWIILKVSVFCWNLQTFDDAGINAITNNYDYKVLHVSIFYVRAFIIIQNNRNLTNHSVFIIESTWPENLLPIQSRIFPNDLSHAKSLCDCNNIVQAVQTAVDQRNGLLWVLDNGSSGYCAPKLIVYDLLRGNNEVHRHVFNGFINNSFKGIQLLNFFENSKSNTILPTSDAYAIILLHKQDYLILYSMLENSTRKLSFVKNHEILSNIYLIPNEISLRNNDELLISNSINELWITNLSQIKQFFKKGKSQNLTLFPKKLGSLLGTPQTLSVPTNMDGNKFSYLYYYLPRDGAVLRWSFKEPLTAEGHDVLYLSHSPIAQIIFGTRGSVWIIYKYANELGDHSRRILNFLPFSGPHKLF